jgi:hypothetical protein
MKICLTRHGGWTAGMRLPPLVLDLSSLPKEVAEEFFKLVEAAKAFPAQKERYPGKSRDAQTYTIMIDEGPEPTVLSQSDSNMSAQFAALIERIEQVKRSFPNGN